MQLDFLKKTIDNNYLSSDNIYVFFHQILWRESDNQFSYIKYNSSSGRGDSINFWDEVEPIFHNLPNQVFMFSGDLGASWSSDVTYDQYDNITLISTGMGDENGENFIIVNVHLNKQINYELICLSDTHNFCLGDLTSYQTLDGKKGNNSSQLVLFPNPATNYIVVKLNSITPSIVRIYSLQGQLILEEEIYNYKKTISVAHIPKGMYFLSVLNNSTESVVKFILE